MIKKKVLDIGKSDKLRATVKNLKFCLLRLQGKRPTCKHTCKNVIKQFKDSRPYGHLAP